MCASIYQKTSEKTLILSPREGMQRAFDFGAWTEIRMGMYFSFIDASLNNAAGPDEIAAISNFSDYFTFGLKNTDNTALPGDTTSRFFGMGMRTTNVTKASTVIQSAAATGEVFGYELGTLKAGSGAIERLNFPSDPSPATNYCGFYAIKMVITNLGLATQTITVSDSASGTTTGGTYSASLLLSDLNTFAAPSTARTIAWNDGAVAFTIPDGWFLRCPLYNNRMRISCIRMKRYA